MTVEKLPEDERARPSVIPEGRIATPAARAPVPGAGLSELLSRLAFVAAQLLSADGAEVCVPTAAGTVVGASGSKAAGDGSLAALAAQASGPMQNDDVRAPTNVPADVRAYLAVPLPAEPGGSQGGLCVYTAQPREWSSTDVALLEQFAVSAAAQVGLSALASEYEASRSRWDLAIEAAGIGSFDWDLRTGELVWDDQLLALFGYDDKTFDSTIEAFNSRVHPDDAERVSQELAEAIERCSEFQLEYRIRLPRPSAGSTEERWIEARGRSLCDQSGSAVRLLGSAYDSTEKKQGEIRFTRVLETMSAAFYSLDPQWRFTYVNAEAERLLGRRREELVGRKLWDLFPAASDSAFGRVYRESMATGRPATFEEYYPAPLDRWYELRVWPGPEAQLWVFFLDITDRRRAIEAAERSAERLALLATVSTELATTLDALVAVPRLAHIVVPALGDWCIVSLVGQTGELGDVGWWHSRPEQRPLVERYASLRLAAMDDSSFPARALRTGRPVVVDTGAAEAIAALLRPGEARDILLTGLNPEGIAVLPLRARGRTVGLLSLYRDVGRDTFGPEDLAIAEEVARRAGAALDNALLYEQQRRRSEHLQRSLLSDPPQPDHLQIEVRYEPAAEAAQVGGDWYDAFLQPDGGTVLVIGDVVGHDIAAAAAMGQVRGLLRGIAYTTGAGPAEIVSRLDQALDGLRVGTMATAVVARLEQTAAQRAEGFTSLRWSNAGHPPPMVSRLDGTVEILGSDAPDLLLGIYPQTERGETELVLERGATVLFYTDGLVERRGQSLDEGLERLRAALVDVHGLPLDRLCDEVLARLLPPDAEDDAALVAVRLHPQDAPRPDGVDSSDGESVSQ